MYSKIHLKKAVLYGLLAYLITFILCGSIINISTIYLNKYSGAGEVFRRITFFIHTYIPLIYIFISMLFVFIISVWQAKNNPILSEYQGGLIGLFTATISIAASYLYPHDPIPINGFTPLFFFMYISSGWIGYKIAKVINSSSNNIIDNKLSQQGITKRERDVINLLIHGDTNNEIGQKLFITEDTVKTHVKSIFKKLACKNRVELVSKLNEKNTSF